tara:strand:+ start:1396 stop:1599 length:204 start_codon:yes stop_codon:yes gene_type:complete
MKVFEVVITESRTATYTLEAQDHDDAVEKAKERLKKEIKIKPYHSTMIRVLGEEDHGISVHKITTRT